MQPHPIGLARGDRNRCDAVESREGLVVPESLDVLSGRDEELCRVLGADAATRGQGSGTFRRQLREVHVHFIDLLIE